MTYNRKPKDKHITIVKAIYNRKPNDNWVTTAKANSNANQMTSESQLRSKEEAQSQAKEQATYDCRTKDKAQLQDEWNYNLWSKRNDEEGNENIGEHYLQGQIFLSKCCTV